MAANAARRLASPSSVNAAIKQIADVMRRAKYAGALLASKPARVDVKFLGGGDGVVRQDRLGLDSVYVQAKKYKDKVVGRPEVQSFAGSLDGQHATKGVFIATTDFSGDARKFVQNTQRRSRSWVANNWRAS
jgi:restriction endonuclease Mrr